VLDVKTRGIVAEWPNGCAASRGLAVDEPHGFFFAGASKGHCPCSTPPTMGAFYHRSRAARDSDVIGYSSTLGSRLPRRNRLPMPRHHGRAPVRCLSFLAAWMRRHRLSCAAATIVDHAWFCEPDGGQLWRIDDPYAATM